MNRFGKIGASMIALVFIIGVLALFVGILLTLVAHIASSDWVNAAFMGIVLWILVAMGFLVVGELTE